jgi:serine/threonine-protein kinase
MAIMTVEPARLVESAPGVPPLLVSVVERCLRKQPEARYQSVAELAQALSPLASPRGLQSVERISRVLGLALSSSNPALAYAGAATASHTSPAVSAPGPGTYAAWGETKAPLHGKSRSKTPLALLLSVLLIGLVASGVFVARRFVGAAAVASSKPSEETATSKSAVAEPVASMAPKVALPPAPIVEATEPSAAASASAVPALGALPSANPKNTNKPATHAVAAAPKPKPASHVAAAMPAASPAPEPVAPAPRSRL